LLVRLILPPAPEPSALELKLPVVLIEPIELVRLMFPPLAVLLPDPDDTFSVIMLPLAERVIAPPGPSEVESKLPVLIAPLLLLRLI
jgi:hypothetical protein